MSDEILSYIKNAVDRIEKKQDKHEDRIIVIEKWQSNAEGKVTMIGVIGVAIGGFITWLTDVFRNG